MENLRASKENSTIAKNTSNVDQIPHQTILTEDGRTIDLDQKHYHYNELTRKIEFDEDGKVIAELAKEKLTYGDFVRTYKQSAKQALLMLLALQSNSTPLKRGGVDIAYMTDLLLDHMIVQFSEEANTIWEAMAAMQSSNPENDHFRITADDIKPYTDYKSDEALYHAFKKGCKEIDNMELVFDLPDADVDGHSRSVPWKDGGEWVGRNMRTGEKAHYDVWTNDLYRVMMASSGLLHGAHWNRKVIRSLKGYARALYLFCARNKKYTKYNGAIEGRKELTVEQTRYELRIDSNTEPRGIWRRLKEAQEKVNALPDGEFQISIAKIPEKGKIEGFRFDIKENHIIDTDAKEQKKLP